MDTSAIPDVQIIVSPDPSTGEWVVAAIYPGVVPKEKAMARAKQVIALAGWKAHGLTFETRALAQDADVKRLAPATAAMSSVSFETADNAVDWRAGSVALEPLVRAYRDLTRVNVLYMIPGSFAFHGLRQFSDANVDIGMSGGGTAYAYTVTVKNHGLGALHLPAVQDPPAAAAPAAAPKSGGKGPVVVAAIVAAALLAGGSAFVGVRRWVGRPATD